jgi:DNA mismatch endonuclease (patch repair protein)
MDRISKEHRSWNMAQISGKDTTPELTVRSLLHRLGYRFRLHRKDLPGQPDIVLPRHQTVIFVHGCYWHRHKGCRFAYTPKTRTDFWQRKFEENVARDIRTRKRLRKLGWRIIIVWECETRDLEALAERLLIQLKKEDPQHEDNYPHS